ncbi:MAG: hypothetical protein NVS1B5_14590 [Gemmatimonadaceae bacterium]
MSFSPFEALEDAMMASSRDWSLDENDAQVYAIVIGWGEAMADVAAKHRWSRKKVQMLQEFQRQYEAIAKGRAFSAEDDGRHM